jgi:hypothetical protein
MENYYYDEGCDIYIPKVWNLMDFPEIKENQVVLFKTEYSSGRVLNEYFTYWISNSQNNSPYTVFENSGMAKQYIAEKSKIQDDVEYYVIGKQQNTLYHHITQGKFYGKKWYSKEYRKYIRYYCLAMEYDLLFESKPDEALKRMVKLYSKLCRTNFYDLLDIIEMWMLHKGYNTTLDHIKNNEVQITPSAGLTTASPLDIIL